MWSKTPNFTGGVYDKFCALMSERHASTPNRAVTTQRRGFARMPWLGGELEPDLTHVSEDVDRDALRVRVSCRPGPRLRRLLPHPRPDLSQSAREPGRDRRRQRRRLRDLGGAVRPRLGEGRRPQLSGSPAAAAG